MSDEFSKKFSIFWTKLSECPFELPIEIQTYMKTSLQTAGFSTVNTTASSSNSNTNTETKTKKLSSYNIFMQQKMAELKTEGVASGERMGKVAALWKALSDEDKAQFKASNPGTTGTTATKVSADPSKVKKLTGYQLYVRETMAEVKADTTVLPKERLGAIAKKWKVLTDDEKTVFKTKASAL